MVDFITPVVEILTGLCGYSAKWADSIRQLGDNLNSLKNASDELRERYLDVKNKVESAEKNPDPELTVLKVVKGWMGRVEGLQEKVQDILKKGDQEIKARCFGGRCPKNCRASYKLHKEVTQKLSDVNDLISKGQFDVVAGKHARDLFDELPVDTAVGVESTYEELCSCFENNQVGIIGLYGMGGVGKTTLLKKFNNVFLSTKVDYVVIWVVASKDANPGKIQDVIRKKLHVEDDIWNDKTMEERAILLTNILNEKKFVLLLDDVWERIDLLKLGVPSRKNHKCKIIFTTRSKEICGLMDAQRCIKVNCLTPDKSFELFKEKVGETTLRNPYIFNLAKQVVDECQGLPLALCTVGRAMATKETPSEWERAIQILKSHPSKVKGVVEDLYYLLEFSYDRLSNDICKPCFLYCALFPEDYDIQIDDLILLWIAEGFLAEFDDDIHEARKQGQDIILSLKYACLLENGEKENTIKMHDVIRDMALWIACDHGEKTRFFVRDCSVTSYLEVYNHAKWKEVERLSMWGTGEMITNFSQKPHCPNLISLLIRKNHTQIFPTEVFVLPSAIRVLDLSDNDGIRNLASAIGDFVNLEYMNLSYTHIEEFPEELKNLKKLRFLLLDGLDRLKLFPKQLISSLLSLRAFSMRQGVVIDETMLLEELEGLDHLQYIRISVFRRFSVKKILSSSKLQRCMSGLFVEAVVSSLLTNLFSSLEKMEHLEELSVEDGSLVEESEAEGGRGAEEFEAVYILRSTFWEHKRIIILRQLYLSGCHNIVDLTWLIHAPNLELLQISRCDSLEEVISEDFGTADIEIVKSNLFCSLTFLYLWYLKNLRSICRMALQFPCLKEILVTWCPNLKKLPFNSQSALKNLQRFEGDTPRWLDQMQWEDETTKQILSPKFQWGSLILERDFSSKKKILERDYAVDISHPMSPETERLFRGEKKEREETKKQSVCIEDKISEINE